MAAFLAISNMSAVDAPLTLTAVDPRPMSAPPSLHHDGGGGDDDGARGLAPPATGGAPLSPSARAGVMRASCQAGLRALAALRRRQQQQQQQAALGLVGAELDGPVAAQAAVVLADLRALQAELRDVARAAEGHRWRRWLLGGAM